mmetsp:Transcript_1656/g.4962  ORF Transcript_1656/g.4962 Transcript_1656/m.4962 type:complete len:715 (+) Transcript_1656:64-2208(+)
MAPRVLAPPLLAALLLARPGAFADRADGEALDQLALSTEAAGSTTGAPEKAPEQRVADLPVGSRSVVEARDLHQVQGLRPAVRRQATFKGVLAHPQPQRRRNTLYDTVLRRTSGLGVDLKHLSIPDIIKNHSKYLAKLPLDAITSTAEIKRLKDCKPANFGHKQGDLCTEHANGEDVNPESMLDQYWACDKSANFLSQAFAIASVINCLTPEVAGWNLVKWHDLGSQQNVECKYNEHVGIYRREHQDVIFKASAEKPICVLTFSSFAQPMKGDLRTVATQDAGTWCGFTLVHSGFAERIDHFMKGPESGAFMHYLKTECGKVIGVGHSMGGALITLFSACANRADDEHLQMYTSKPLFRGVKVHGLFTFGAPGVSQKEKNAMFNVHDEVAFNGLRIYNQDSDAVDPIACVGRANDLYHPMLQPLKLEVENANAKGNYTKLELDRMKHNEAETVKAGKPTSMTKRRKAYRPGGHEDLLHKVKPVLIAGKWKEPVGDHCKVLKFGSHLSDLHTWAYMQRTMAWEEQVGVAALKSKFADANDQFLLKKYGELHTPADEIVPEAFLFDPEAQESPRSQQATDPSQDANAELKRLVKADLDRAKIPLTAEDALALYPATEVFPAPTADQNNVRLYRTDKSLLRKGEYNEHGVPLYADQALTTHAGTSLAWDALFVGTEVETKVLKVGTYFLPMQAELQSLETKLQMVPVVRREYPNTLS